MTIHAVGPGYVRESDMPDMDWGECRRVIHGRPPLVEELSTPTGPPKYPWYVGFVGAALFGGAIWWLLIEIGFRSIGL